MSVEAINAVQGGVQLPILRDPGAVATALIRWGGVTVADETLTIDGTTYEFDDTADPGSVTAGNIRVDITGGTSAAIGTDALIAAVQARQHLTGITAVDTGDTDEVLLIRLAPGVFTGVITEATTNIVVDAAFAGGKAPGRRLSLKSRVPDASEATENKMYFAFPFTVSDATVQERVTTGGALEGITTAGAGLLLTITNFDGFGIVQVSDGSTDVIDVNNTYTVTAME